MTNKKLSNKEIIIIDKYLSKKRDEQKWLIDKGLQHTRKYSSNAAEIQRILEVVGAAELEDPEE